MKITELIYKLGTMIYEPNVALKMGSVSIGLKMESGEHFLIGRTHGDYLEVHRDIVNKNINKIEGSDWLYFKVEGLNIDNY